MKHRSVVLALFFCAPLLLDVAQAHSKGKSSSGYRVVSGGHHHSSRGFTLRPTFYSNRYPRFYPTNSRSNFIQPAYRSSWPVGYRAVPAWGTVYSGRYYQSHTGYIGRPYIHVRNGWGGCHPYTHYYHHDDWRLRRVRGR
jgi:hypothetical protein